MERVRERERERGNLFKLSDKPTIYAARNTHPMLNQFPST